MADANDKTSLSIENFENKTLVKVFQNLNYKSLNIARRTCKRWKSLIDVEDLVQKCWKRLCK